MQGIPQASASLLREGGRVADRIPLSVFEENTRIIRDHMEDIERGRKEGETEGVKKKKDIHRGGATLILGPHPRLTGPALLHIRPLLCVSQPFCPESFTTHSESRRRRSTRSKLPFLIASRPRQSCPATAATPARQVPRTPIALKTKHQAGSWVRTGVTTSKRKGPTSSIPALCLPVFDEGRLASFRFGERGPLQRIEGTLGAECLQY